MTRADQAATGLSSAEARLGAWVDGGGTHFCVWAPDAARVVVAIEGVGDVPLRPSAHGYHAGFVPGVGAGARYRYRLDERGPFPDPASRFQPDGVHAASEVVDLASFSWRDAEWQGLDPARLVIYEMHVGTWTADGTFVAAVSHLEHLVELGVTAVQLMPVADFPGQRNWGYDAVSLFAPARCYGHPDDLRAFVDRAHQLGLGVIFDVVYNHFGPDGAYHGQFSRQYFNEAVHSMWGAGINLDGPGSREVREFFIQSALCWLREYHADGFRLDATHALHDQSEHHFLAEYTERVRAGAGERPVPVLIAEDHRNLAKVVQPVDSGGYGFDAVITDDFHHEMRRMIAGDREGYYQDFEGTAEGLALTLRQGWRFTGQFSPYWQEPRGSDPAGLSMPCFVHCIQNHDQIGNRPFGDRLPETAGLPSTRAATAVLLCSAATPMLFMGEEWAASTPFEFFTDHNPELGRAVSDGRRNEFSSWNSVLDADALARLPDPQAIETFEASKIRWDEAGEEPHASMLRMHRRLLALRASEPALAWGEGAVQDAAALDETTIALIRQHDTDAVVLIAHLAGDANDVELPADAVGSIATEGWEIIFDTEDARFTPDPQPIEVDGSSAALACRFRRPGAVLAKRRSAEPTP